MKATARLIAIGDIHGHAIALRTILEIIQPKLDDTVVTLGDYVNRGPDSRSVLDLLLDLENHCRLVSILGNHDETLLEAIDDPRQLQNWFAMGGRSTLDSYQGISHPKDVPTFHRAFLQRCVPYHETAAYIFTHANYAPNLRLADHNGMTLRWLPLEPPFPSPHYSGKCVVLGHTPQANQQILDLPHLKCLDTGMGLGGLLSALDLGTGELWQVDVTGQRIQNV